MRIVTAVGAAVLALGLAGAVRSADWADEAEWADSYAESQALCRQVKGLSIPAADRPTSAEAAALKGCDSEALYYGIGRPADPVAARQCAILEMEDPQAYGQGEFMGPVILATVYANGAGVRRNPQLALHMACLDEDGAPAERDGRARHLAAREPGETFHWCDDVTSGRMAGACAAHEARIAEAKRETEIAAITAGWTAPETTAFERLRAAHAALVEARADEVDVSGTLRGAMVIGEQEAAREALKALLVDLDQGRAPAGDLRSADAELNAVYRRVMGAGEEARLDWGTVTPEAIRQAQRAWLRYRDAWLAFAKLKYPDVKPDALAARLTRERTAVLKGFLGEN